MRLRVRDTTQKKKKKKISERFGFRLLRIAASLGLIAVAVLDGKLVFGKPIFLECCCGVDRSL